VVAEATAALDRLAEEHEVIIVNDGSSDDTAAVGETLSRADPRVRVVHHEVNRGYGAAVRTGIESAKLDYVFFTDGDGQFRVAELERLLPRLEGADAVLGYRLDRQDHLLRKLNGAAWTFLMDLVFHLRVRDVDCAFKIFRRSIFDGMTLRSSGAMISAEMIARLRRRRARIVQMGVHHYPRIAGNPTGANPFVILKAFVELFHLSSDIYGTRGPEAEA
jgi:glycosyltransferase involved in cell wall biosynthesis